MSCLQHLQYVGACDARTKKPVAINLADVSNLVTDRRNLADGRLQPLLSVRFPTQTAAGILPCVRCEEQRRDLTEVEVVNNAQRLRSRGPGPERAREGLAFAFRQCFFNLAGRYLAENCSIDLTDDAAQSALGFHNALPHCLSAG